MGRMKIINERNILHIIKCKMEGIGNNNIFGLNGFCQHFLAYRINRGLRLFKFLWSNEIGKNLEIKNEEIIISNLKKENNKNKILI
jgi:hypothetical protein